MPNTGTTNNSLSNLTAKINAQAEAERQALERQMETEFKTFCSNLRKCATAVLTTMEKDMAATIATTCEKTAGQMKLLSSGFMKHWLMCGLLGLALTLGLALGGWTLATLASRHVTSLRQGLADLNQQKTTLEATVSQLQSQTWSLTLTDNTQGKFIILPQGVTPKTGWTFGKQEAVKLE